MDTDVEMSIPAEIPRTTPSKSPSLASPPPASDSSHTSHVAEDDTETQSASAGSESSTTPVETEIVDGEPVVNEEGKSPTPALEATSPEDAAAKPASAAAKPKSTKTARPPRSPSPTPPPPPPELQTIRLHIPLGGPDAYQVDISTLAKSNGQRSPTPPPQKIDTSDSEGDDEASGKDKDQDDKKKRKRKKNLASEYYDLTDPFIDDSDLALDQRTHFAQTKQQGFYVSSGEVALLKEKTPKKPKSKKLPLIPLAHPSISVKRESETIIAGPSSASPLPLGEGTRDTPIPIMSDNEDSVSGLKRKSSLGATDAKGKKKRKTADIRPFHPELEQMIEQLKLAISKESWEIKGKFPPNIKPLLAQVAVKAIQLDEYDDNFFNVLPRIFPYNRFTMTKLVKRTVFHDHMQLLTERQEVLLQQLAEIAREGFPKAKEEWERSVAAWERRQEKAKVEAEASGVGSTEGTPFAAPPPPPEDNHINGDMDAEGGHLGVNGAGKEGGREPHPPAKKYRLTEQMKAIIWNLVLLSNECCRIENEKNSLENSPLQVSEQGLRKVLYQKIVAAYPDGWMSSGHISREVSAMKKRFEKEALENESS
ncbi:hypothetical protein OE88DRAFT_549061 [Heliocybe sulcata]|uniref:Ubinuclein middle domain-containing protein n=1 Tax=Heliocybe sulcata TaxID=5364 RepID=A0A5C3MTR7_9AGAM|nr:hypothetical protein OE88DRAFT_549061 [Heliocybe sulcata]